ncbi:hypothetical protein E2562_033980 [Oryza meyeriana var. granulata]|uniref:Uncharacterized protein n=1 Tax=Oryza meyeriana var. granulata TaxID=110450 RepID=A0A6G1C2M2_9ORYZ|nr:hypothetical protein E2562_033980 [Oryza meyeriana var. granulata]
MLPRPIEVGSTPRGPPALDPRTRGPPVPDPRCRGLSSHPRHRSSCRALAAISPWSEPLA